MADTQQPQSIEELSRQIAERMGLTKSQQSEDSYLAMVHQHIAEHEQALENLRAIEKMVIENPIIEDFIVATKKLN